MPAPVGASAIGASAAGALAVGAFAVGAFAVGAFAIGALAVGRLAIRRLAIRASHIHSLRIDDLSVERWNPAPGGGEWPEATGERRPPSPADEAAVRRLYQGLMDAWNQGDGDAFAALYIEDGDHVGFDGSHVKGRAEIATLHQQLFDTFLKDTRLVGKVRGVRFVTPEVAVMHAIGGTVMPGESDLDPERNSIQTLVAAKRDGEWRLVAFQNTRAHSFGRPDAVQAMTEELRREL